MGYTRRTVKRLSAVVIGKENGGLDEASDTGGMEKLISSKYINKVKSNQ